MHKIYLNFLSGETKLTDCLRDSDPEAFQHLNELWMILSKAHNFFSKPEITKHKKIEIAIECKKFTAVFPLFFPEAKITRKMHIFSFT